jgi:hypothetical protein
LEPLLSNPKMDQSAFLFTPDSLISSPGETMYSSSQNDSSPLVESDFQAPENSSSDKEACFTFDNQLTDVLGFSNSSIGSTAFNPLLNDLQVSAFEMSSLPPLPIVEVVPSNISSDEDNNENQKKDEGRPNPKQMLNLSYSHQTTY